MARNKPKGWMKEPVRHGLAAKGIKTGYKKGPKQVTVHGVTYLRSSGVDTEMIQRYKRKIAKEVHGKRGQTITVRARHAGIAKMRAITRIQKSKGTKRNRTHKVVVSRVKWNRRAVKDGNLRSYRVIWHIVRR